MAKKAVKKVVNNLVGKRYLVKDNSDNWFNLGEHVIITEDTNKGLFARSLERSMSQLHITLEHLTPFETTA